MATNLALDEKILEKALEVGEQKTKKDTVNQALQEYIERRQQKRIVKLFGSIDWGKSYDYKKKRSRK